METFLRYWTSARERLFALWERYRSLSTNQKRAFWVAVAIVLVGGIFMLNKSRPISDEAAREIKREVEVRSVAELTSGAMPLSVVGTVSSKSEATVRAESSGEVTGVSRQLGDSVAAGTIVAQLSNAAQRAAVMQAQGVVDAANAAFAKVKKGTREEQLAILRSTADAARSGVVNTLLSAYAAVDNAVTATADTMFSNPTGGQPHFNILTANTQAKASAETARLTLAPVLVREAQMAASISVTSDLSLELTRAESEIRTVRTFIDTILVALNAGIATTDYTSTEIAAYISSASAARTALTSSLSSITSARSALEVAEKNLSQGVVGAQKEDVDASQASVTQAEGALAAARANLEKTIIRAPISGTINSFSLKRGDFVQATTPVLTVANNGALEVVAYVSEKDARQLAAGNTATLEGVRGTITRVAPALDPITKRIEVRIGLPQNSRAFVNGQSVVVNFDRTSSTTEVVGELSIPISALKVGADTYTVFSVDVDGKLIPHEVELGELQGDRVVIMSGLTADSLIVTDARGLRAGDIVSVK